MKSLRGRNRTGVVDAALRGHCMPRQGEDRQRSGAAGFDRVEREGT
ncbi:MAG: hypothetical protein R3F45_16230 [Gammaproteobacteria bacterium]